MRRTRGREDERQRKRSKNMEGRKRKGLVRLNDGSEGFS